MNVVSCRIFDPTKSLFKQPANAKASCETIHCSLDSCPLRDAGYCMLAPVIGRTRCPYGKVNRETGPTKRARSFYPWLQERRKKYDGIPRLDTPPKMLAVVGDYVYLPYSHITMNEDLPFSSHASLFASGTCLLKKEDWTVENVIKIIDFVPRTIFGDHVIESYHKEEIPKFLLHLREQDSDMWQQLVKEKQTLDQEPDHVGRKAFLSTLNYPIEWTTKHPKYNVTWTWDGEFVTTASPHAYHHTWGDIEIHSMELKAKPCGNTVIVVKDNSWVNPSTKFET